jgi:hypothetical protein
MAKVSLERLLIRLTILALVGAPLASAQAAPLSHDELFEATIDHQEVAPRDAAAVLGRHLARVLEELAPLEATHLATTWALADDPLRRAGVASALEWTFPLLGDAEILDHLSRDADPGIRLATARAAWSRRAFGGDPGVLARLSNDDDPEVREVARHAR